MIPVPRVSVKNSERYPSRPRAGSLKRIRTVPTPGFFMSSRVARRGPSFSITTPRYPSGQSIISSSYGSSCSPFGPSRGMMRGRLTWNSYPSRRIVSISTPRWSSPRPDTVNVWGSSVSSTRSATLRSSSRNNRSRSCRPVTNFPSRPANGESLTLQSTEIVGSSTAMPASRSRWSGAVIVFPISTPASPASATISPAAASSSSTRSRPSNPNSLTTRACSYAPSPRGPGGPSGSTATVSPTHPAPLDPPDRDPPQIRRIVQGRDEHLQRPAHVRLGRRDRAEDGLEQRLQIGPGCLQIEGRRAGPARRIKEGAVELLGRRLELQEQLQHLVVHPQRLGILAVDLVHQDDRLEPQRQRLSRHELGLRHRPIGGIDEQQEAVHHPQNPLHFAPEVRVPRRVHNVDLGLAPADRGVLRQDRDAALALERVRVQHPLTHLLVGAEHSRLA